jgi:hypothetical protein
VVARIKGRLKNMWNVDLTVQRLILQKDDVMGVVE